jgi:hypothetical protein
MKSMTKLSIAVIAVVLVIAEPIWAKDLQIESETSFLPGSLTTKDFLGGITSVTPYRGKPSVLISLDDSKSLLASAYDHAHFDPDKSDGQQGYFRADKQYRYDAKRHFFYIDEQLMQGAKSAWDGRFLNWLAMRQIDVVRRAMTGGSSRLSKYKKGWLVDVYHAGQPSDVMTISSPLSHKYSPVMSHQEVRQANGKLSFSGKSYQLVIFSANKPKGMIQQLAEVTDFWMLDENLKPHGSVLKLLSLFDHWQPDSHQYASDYGDVLSRIKRIRIFLGEESANSLFYEDELSSLLPCKPLIILDISNLTSPTVSNESLSYPLSEDCRPDMDGEQSPELFYFHPQERKVIGAEASKGNRYSSRSKHFWLKDRNSLEFQLKFPANGKTVSSSHIGSSSLLLASDGSGALLQTHFSPTRRKQKDVVHWSGDVSALMVDENGLLRSDNGDRRLSSSQEDPYLDSCFDTSENKLRVKLSKLIESRPNKAEQAACSKLVYNKEASDIGYLWQAQQPLSRISRSDIVKQRAPYNDESSLRYIRTHINNIEQDFIADSFSEQSVGLLDVESIGAANALINYVRGLDQNGMRSRNLDGEQQMLGDFVYSKPVALNKPAENIHLLYDDASYLDFYRQYRNRRTMVYAGANDGMIHAFNGGWYDEKSKLHSGRANKSRPWTLGQETWAFIPFNLLPHLKHLARESYGESSSDHMGLVDQSPYVFDAKIFNGGAFKGQADRRFHDDSGAFISHTTHPNGWGTLMVVGFGATGGAVEIYPDPDDKVKSKVLRPSYLIFDITDPEQAPVLLREFSHDKLGASGSLPSTFTLRQHDGELQWFLAIGSGASTLKGRQQGASLFILDLHTMALASDFASAGVLEIDEGDAYVGGIVAADYDLDASTDALYFGTVIGGGGADKNHSIGGKLFRLRTAPMDKTNKMLSSHSTLSWRLEEMFDAKAAIPFRPMISADAHGNRWVHFSSGRLQTQNDLLQKHRTHIKSKRNKHSILYGLKEPRDKNGRFLMDIGQSRTRKISYSDLVDVSSTKVDFQNGRILSHVKTRSPEPLKTVYDLESFIVGAKGAKTSPSGWYKRFPEHEYLTGETTLLGGLYSLSSFKSTQYLCESIGESFLYTLRYTTGTAWPERRKRYPSKQLGSRAEAIRNSDRVSIGSQRASSIVQHLGPLRQHGLGTQLHLNSDGSVKTRIEQFGESIKSAEISWKAL